MTVLEEDVNCENLEGAKIASTETDHFETMPSGSKPLQTSEAFVGGLPALVRIVVYDARTIHLEVRGDVSVGEKSLNNTSERVKKEWGRSVANVHA